MLGNLPMTTKAALYFVMVYFYTPAHQQLLSYLDLSFAHDLVHDLVVVFVEHALVITFLVAQDAQVLGALQLYFKLLFEDIEKGRNIVVLCLASKKEQCTVKML